MTELTRRRRDETFECWGIYFRDVEIGALSKVNGLGSSTHWTWCCGFYPGCDTTQLSSGRADTFDEVKAALAAAWEKLRPQVTDAMMIEWKRDRAFTAWKYAMHDARCQMPTQNTAGRSKCFCGDEIAIAHIEDHIREKHFTHEHQIP